jgi:hypothetical protein
LLYNRQLPVGPGRPDKNGASVAKEKDLLAVAEDDPSEYQLTADADRDASIGDSNSRIPKKLCYDPAP